MKPLRVSCLVLLIALVTACTSISFVREGGTMDPMSETPMGAPFAFGLQFSHGSDVKLSQDLKLPNPRKKLVSSKDRGHAIFRSFCQTCHGPDATGNKKAASHIGKMPANLRALAGKVSDGYLYRQIARGPIGMPSWREVLADEAIWDVVNYIQSLED